MSKRTNKLYNVTVVKYASMIVEADSPKEAMELAKQYKDEYVEDWDFEDSGIDVHSCDADPSDIDFFCLDDGDNVYTKDGVMSCEEYIEELEENEDEEKDS